MMRKISKKRGLSEVVAYVLLIAIAISLSIAVYAWIKVYLPKDVTECPEEISLMITEYNCDEDLINLTVENKGLFDIDGFYMKYASETDEIPILYFKEYPKDYTKNPSEDTLNSSVYGNDTGLGDTPVTFSVTTDVSTGTLTFNSDGTYTYVPDADFIGEDSFTYTVCDTDGECSTATDTITVLAPNILPGVNATGSMLYK